MAKQSLSTEHIKGFNVVSVSRSSYLEVQVVCCWTSAVVAAAQGPLRCASAVAVAAVALVLGAAGPCRCNAAQVRAFAAVAALAGGLGQGTAAWVAPCSQAE